MAPIVCLVCGANAHHKCANCCAVAYCSRSCQKSDWPQHKKTCANIPFGISFVWRSKMEDIVEAISTTNPEIPKLEAGKDLVFAFDVRAPLEKVVPVDCALFIQLACILSSQTTATPRPYRVGLGACCSVLLKMFDTLDINDEKLKIQYIYPADKDAVDDLHGRSSNCGLWVAGPDKKDRYLSMSENGPARRPLEEWHALLLKGIAEEAAALPADAMIAICHLRLAHCRIQVSGWKLRSLQDSVY